jgi:PAS domain S-box-containing protein
MDKEGKIIEANERAADSYGHSRKELLEINVSSLRSAGAAEEGHDIIKRIEDSKEDGKVYTTEHRRRDGTTFPIEVSARAIEIDGEKVFMAIIRDITKRMKAENLLKESEERFRRLFETAKDGLLLIEKNTGKIIPVNPAIVELLGYSQEEFLGRGIEDVGLLKEMDNFQQLTEKLDKDGYICCTDMTLETKEGKNIIVDSYLIDKARIIQCNIRDITERKRAQEEREKLESQLFQAQKMEAVGQLAGGIAHDFNNALNVIMGFCTLTQIKMNPDDPCMEYLNEILAATQKAANLTQSLLAFSRKQPITIKPLSLNQTLSTVGKLLLNFLGEDIHLDFRLSERDIVIMGDSGQIDQVMMNLATNARDSMPDGGTLTISTQLTEIGDEFRRMHGYGEAGTYALISVEDSGMGMDDETKQRIFEPFFTTKEVGRGTGLGLAIIYGIVKQHNGYIDVYSELGRGTIFRIYLPAIDVKAEEALSTQYIPLIGGTEMILLVEDEKALRTVTKDLLERYGYRVIEAQDGIDAVQKFAEHKDTINLVLMDVIMPNKNGKEAYQEILAIRPDAHVIFLSGYTNNIITKKILDEGWELLLKPVSPRELFRRIREVLEREKA